MIDLSGNKIQQIIFCITLLKFIGCWIVNKNAIELKIK